jgi:hypothetical protein
MSNTQWVYMVEMRVLDSAGDDRTIFFATEEIKFPPITPVSWRYPGGTYPTNQDFRYPGTDGRRFYEDRVIPGLVKGFPRLTVSMFEGFETRGGLSVDVGSVELDNESGVLDGLLTTYCTGNLVLIWRVNRDDISEHHCVWCGTAEGFVPAPASVEVKLRGVQFLYDVEFRGGRFAGTNSGGNGTEGTADDLKGKYKPLAMGDVYNIEPVLVNGGKLIYQIDGQNGSLASGYTIAVYDQRSLLTNAGTYASKTDLENNALAPAAGSYKVYPSSASLSGGIGAYIRLGASPTGAVTVDLANPATPHPRFYGLDLVGNLPGGSSGFSTLYEAQYLLITLIQMRNQDSAVGGKDLYVNPQASYLSPHTKLTYPTSQDAGLYRSSEATFLEMMNLLLQSLGAAMCINYYQWTQAMTAGSGGIAYYLAQLRPLSGGTTDTLTITQDDIIKGSFSVGLTSDGERGQIPSLMKFKWQRNYRVMSKTDAPGLTDAQLAPLTQEWRDHKSNATLSQFFPQGPVVNVETALNSSAAASSLASDVAAHAYDRTDGHGIFTVTVDVEASFFDDWMTDETRNYPGVAFGEFVAYYVQWPRFGFDGGDIPCWLLGYERTEADGVPVVRLTLLPQTTPTITALEQ